MVSGLMSCIMHRIQLSEQLEICGFLVVVSAPNHSITLKESPYNDVSGILIDFPCVLVYVLLH